jgi:hypothetical protein
MNITVQNTVPATTRITLVGEMHDGTFDAEVMTETAVPYTPYWDNLLEQRIVYIQPDDERVTELRQCRRRHVVHPGISNRSSHRGSSNASPADLW